jgi:hypothetical protein
MGFITNPDEEQLLASPAHQGRIVDALVDSVVRFRAWLEGGRPARDTAPRQPPQGPR